MNETERKLANLILKEMIDGGPDSVESGTKAYLTLMQAIELRCNIDTNWGAETPKP